MQEVFDAVDALQEYVRESPQFFPCFSQKLRGFKPDCPWSRSDDEIETLEQPKEISKAKLRPYQVRISNKQEIRFLFAADGFLTFFLQLTGVSWIVSRWQKNINCLLGPFSFRFFSKIDLVAAHGEPTFVLVLFSGRYGTRKDSANYYFNNLYEISSKYEISIPCVQKCQISPFKREYFLTYIWANMLVIVCPLSLVENWSNEFAAFSPKLKVVRWVGSTEDRDAVKKAIVEHILMQPKSQWSDPDVNFDVLITTYDFAIKDKDFFGRFNWYVS
jgi:SNF2 family DNA or RNA helicase